MGTLKALEIVLNRYPDPFLMTTLSRNSTDPWGMCLSKQPLGNTFFFFFFKLLYVQSVCCRWTLVKFYLCYKNNLGQQDALDQNVECRRTLWAELAI